MSNLTKVTLSAAELAMANDINVILTKRLIIEKTVELFGSLPTTIHTIIKPVLHNYVELLASKPKISTGENYKGLPYVMLDYPATFSKQHIFAVRTMFLWGNFISVTLHVRGMYKQLFIDKLIQLQHIEHAYICIGEAEWEHHFEEDNYLPILQITPIILENIKEKSFFKIALKYKLHQFNLMQQILPEAYSILAEAIKS